MRRRTLALLIVAAAAALAVLAALVPGGDRPGTDRRGVPPPLERLTVGEGPTGATIVRETDTPAGAPVVVFLHGWTATDPETYGPWLRHLARGGSTVIYPTYQEPPFLDVDRPLTNVLLAVRVALDRLDGRPGPLVVAGHSAGGALAADYAASARSAGLPSPRAVLAAYPGRSLPGSSLRLPAVDRAAIPSDTRILALAGARDRVVGTRVARRIVETATRVPEDRRELRLVTDPAVAGHLGPQRATPAARRAFWAPLDEMVRAAAEG